MNKKEIGEIRKNLKSESGFMSIGKVVSVYVKGCEDRIDVEDSILYMNTTHYNLMQSDLSELILKKLCKVLTGKIGKSLLEFKINDPDSILMDTLYGRFETEDNVKNYIYHIIKNTEFISPYVIFAAHCTYSVIHKGEDVYEPDTSDPDAVIDTSNYNFIITCICPVEIQNNGLICTTEPSIESETEFLRVISEPVHGWIYPAFNDRTSDTDCVLYSAKNVKTVSPSLIENVLGGEFFQKATEQKDTFVNVLTKSIGDILDYDTVEQINDSFINILEQSSYETEPVTVNKNDIVTILDNIGCDKEHQEYFKKVWTNNFEENANLNVNALVDDKSTLTAGSFKITYQNFDSERVKITKDSSGKHIITIDIDDDVSINGIKVTS